MQNAERTLFIAIPITEQPQAFQAMQHYYQRELHDILKSEGIFKSSKDLHVTIAYIGAIDDNRIPEIEQAIQEGIDQFNMCSLEPKLIWHNEVTLFNNAVSLTFAYDEGLELLVKCIRTSLGNHAVPFDDKFAFKAHLTIGRITPGHILKKGRIKRAVLELLATPTEHIVNPISVTKLGIYKSGDSEPFKLCAL